MFRFFSNRSRRIFRYWNGTKWIWADPIVLQREIDKAGGDNWTANLDILRAATSFDSSKLGPALLKEQSKAVEEAVAAIVGIVRKSFDAPAIDSSGKGVTEAECVNMLAQFTNWMSEAEIDARPFRNSPPPTDSPPLNPATATS
jgi:hypothetical protein